MIKEEIREYKLQHPEASQRQIAKCFGVHHKTVWKALRTLKLNPGFDEKGKETGKETFESTEDTATIFLSKTHIHTLEELLEYCKVDTSVWEVERFVANSYQMGYKDSNGDANVLPMFQVKAFLKKKKDVLAVKKEIEELKKLAEEYPWEEYPYVRAGNTGLMLEVNIPDLHVGKLAWGVETGGPNYDVKIAESTFWRALETLIHRVSGFKFELVLFVIGNDLLNSDDIEGRTTSGTYVSSDARYHKTFATARTMIIKAVIRLKELGPVKVLPVYGNHDKLSSWHLADSVEMFFSNDTMVEVDNQPRTRKYHQFGKVMLMFTHGDKAKKEHYPLLMATEKPEMFGATAFRECHTGHTHTTKLDEQHGVRVRVLPALCAADDWHADNGYVGNQRNAEAFVWSKTEGLITMVFHNEGN